MFCRHPVSVCGAAGDALGVLHVVEVPRGLKRPLANEAQLLADLIARQTAHLAYLDSRKDVPLSGEPRKLERRNTAGSDSSSLKVERDALQATNHALHMTVSLGSRSRSVDTC